MLYFIPLHVLQLGPFFFSVNGRISFFLTFWSAVMHFYSFQQIHEFTIDSEYNTLFQIFIVPKKKLLPFCAQLLLSPIPPDAGNQESGCMASYSMAVCDFIQHNLWHYTVWLCVTYHIIIYYIMQHRYVWHHITLSCMTGFF